MILNLFGTNFRSLNCSCLQRLQNVNVILVLLIIRQIVRDAQRRSEGNELNFPMAGDICPSQVAPVLVSRGEKIVGEFQQWGLPGFRGRQQIINARAETVTEKPMFRRSVAFQRCVIPATGFYEWDSAKHKYFFQMPGQPIYLAGIYDNINGVNCFIILTTEPNDSVAPIHDRMPLLLSHEQVRPWLVDTRAQRWNCFAAARRCCSAQAVTGSWALMI